MEVYGDWSKGSNYAYVDVVLVPCASVKGHDDCVWEQDEVSEYLGAWNMVVYHNQPKFRPDAYSEDSISKESVLTKIFNPYGAGAQYTEFFINKHELTDKVALF